MQGTRLLLTTSLLAGLALPAAADGYDKQFKYQTAVRADGVDWTGIYSGVHSGGVTGKTTFVRQAGTNTSTQCGGSYQPSCILAGYANQYRNLEINVERTVDIEGFHIGPHIGYQKQFGNMVLGADLGFSVGGGDGKTDCSNSAVANTVVLCESEYKYSVNARARLGYASGNYLWYTTAGLVRAKIQNSVQYTDVTTGETFGEKGSAHPNGYLVGLEVEYQSASGMRWGLGYTHIFLDDVTVRLGDSFGGGSGTRTTPDPDVLGASLRVPLQQQAPQVQDPGPPAAQAPAVAQAQVAPAARPAATPAAARPAAPAAAPAAPAAARTPVPGAPAEPGEPAVKGRPQK